MEKREIQKKRPPALTGYASKIYFINYSYKGNEKI